MPTIYTEVEVDVDLDDFADDDLIEELERRGIQLEMNHPEELRQLIEKMYQKCGLNQNIDEELREFFWRSIGRNL
jgi:hypothetical protein